MLIGWLAFIKYGMLTKSIFFEFAYTMANCLFVSSYLYLVGSFVFLFTSKLRIRFTLFIVNLFIVLLYGVVLYLDGLYFIFTVTELTLVLLFIVVYTQLCDNLIYKILKLKYMWLSLLLFLYTYWENLILVYFSYYDYINSTKSNDFFIFFYFFFYKFSVVTVLLILIISFFSIYFILLYFTLKLLNSNYFNANKHMKFLRKQNLQKQILFKNMLRFFQN